MSVAYVCVLRLLVFSIMLFGVCEFVGVLHEIWREVGRRQRNECVCVCARNGHIYQRQMFSHTICEGLIWYDVRPPMPVIYAICLCIMLSAVGRMLCIKQIYIDGSYPGYWLMLNFTGFVSSITYFNFTITIA